MKKKELLPKAVLPKFVELVARGYTVRRIRQLLEEEGHDMSAYSDALLIAWAQEIAPQAQAVREELRLTQATPSGLTDTYERIRRLKEAAEKIEPLVGESPRWADVYRKLLAQIHEEAQSAAIELPVGDTWRALLEELVRVAKSRMGGAAADSVPPVSPAELPSGKDTTR